MFSYIKGQVSDISPSEITLECNNIGFKIAVPNPYSFMEGEETIVYIYTHIREQEFTLYGFKTKEERELFLKLLKVSGIGPKSSLCIIAYSELSVIKDAIMNDDAKFFNKIPGIGTKTAQQIILDLKGKLNFTTKVTNQKELDIKEALSVLGYKEKDFNKIVKLLDFTKKEDLILKEALKLLNTSR